MAKKTLRKGKAIAKKKKRAAMAKKKLGILSYVTLINSTSFSGSLISEVETGYGQGGSAKRDAVSKNNLITKRNELLDPHGDACQIIATIGGLFVNVGTSNAASPAAVNFVSLVGNIPDSVDVMCRGGVSLDSWKSNKSRVRLLQSKGLNSAGVNNEICLYREDGTHSQGVAATTGVPVDELNYWTTTLGLGLQNVKTCSGSIHNDINGTNAGQGLPQTARGLVIGASPFFLENRNTLVTEVNTWLSAAPVGANRTRYAVYPLQIYNEGNNPLITNFVNGFNILFGPDLRAACRLLGYFASLANDYQTGWFQKMPNVKLEI